MQDNDLINLENEVKGIREAFRVLEQRLVSVENRLAKSSQSNLESHKPISLPRVLLDEGKTEAKLAQSTKDSDESSNLPMTEKPSFAVNSGQGLPPVTKKNLETEIGQYWLNKLGVTSLVVGVIFLILYSFQYCNAPLKLLIGFAVSAALIISGEKIAKDEQRKWYGHGLMGGGWALGYFVVYAMYYISDLKVVYYYPIELALSLALSAAAMMRAVMCKSEVIAVLSASLANYSICISGPSSASNVPIILIAVLVSAVSLKQKWYGLFIWLTLMSYVAHFSASAQSYPIIGNTGSGENFITLIYLVTLLSIFNIAMFFADETESWQRKSLTAATCINALSFLFCLMTLTLHYLTEQLYMLIGVTGICYLLFAPLLHSRKLKQLTTVNLLIGLSFVNAALWMKFTGTSVVIFNLFELALLAIVGLYYDIKAFRWFALPLSLCFFGEWFGQCPGDSFSESLGLTSVTFVLVGILAVIIFASLFWLYSKQKYVAKYNLDSMGYRYAYYSFANFAACCTPQAMLDRMWSLPVWPIQAIVSAFLSIVYGEAFFWFITVLLALCAGFSLLFSISTWLWTPTLLIVAACYALYAYCRKAMPDHPPAKTKIISAIAGNLILTTLLYVKLSSFWLSTGLAIEGLLLLSGGLVLRERVFRISGLLVLALLILKLLFVDLAQVGTLQRIISFIASGVVFLAASYGYSRFTEKFGINK